MTRRVWNLVAIERILLVGAVIGFLKRILQIESDRNLTHSRVKHQRRLHTANSHLSKIQHSPAELLPCRVGYDFVSNRIIVAVSPEFKTLEKSTAKLQSVSHTQIILPCALRLQVGIAYFGVV